MCHNRKLPNTESNRTGALATEAIGRWDLFAFRVLRNTGIEGRTPKKRDRGSISLLRKKKIMQHSRNGSDNIIDMIGYFKHQ